MLFIFGKYITRVADLLLLVVLLDLKEYLN